MTAVTDPAAGSAAGEPFVSIQIGPESLLDEGVEHVLEDVRRRAACNAVLVSTHSFAHGTIGRPPDALHPGHGGHARPDEPWLGGAYVPAEPRYYL